jgi:hypothetical protein
MANPLFDAATSNGTLGVGSTTATFTHTPVGSTNLSFWLWAVSTGTDISAATYGGDAMTKVGSSTGSEAAVGTGTLWVKAGCKTGAQTVSMTKTSADALYTVGATYINTNQSSQSDVSVSSKATSVASIAPNLTTLTDNSLTLLFTGTSGATTTAGSGTQIESAFNALSGNALLDATAVRHPAGSQTLNANNGVTAANWAYIMATILPVPSVIVNSGMFLVM